MLPGWTELVGDWNGDGKSEIGIYKDTVWYLDWNGNGAWDADIDKVYNFGATGWTSVVGDWNGDKKMRSVSTRTVTGISIPMGMVFGIVGISTMDLAPTGGHL